MATPPNPGSAASNARADSSLNTPPNARVNTADRPAARGTSAWLGIGIFLFILLLALVFFVLASGTLRHRYLNREPPPGNPPTAPAPGSVIAH